MSATEQMGLDRTWKVRVSVAVIGRCHQRYVRLHGGHLLLVQPAVQQQQFNESRDGEARSHCDRNGRLLLCRVEHHDQAGQRIVALHFGILAFGPSSSCGAEQFHALGLVLRRRTRPRVPRWLQRLASGSARGLHGRFPDVGAIHGEPAQNPCGKSEYCAIMSTATSAFECSTIVSRHLLFTGRHETTGSRRKF